MRKTGLIFGAALVALLASFSLPTISAFAKREMGMPEMITAAKTPAEHEKLAAHYEREAKAARAKAEEGGRPSDREAPLRPALRCAGEVLHEHGRRPRGARQGRA